MIKIKDYIFNGNEILYIEEFDAQSLGIMFKGKDKAIFVDAHPEDIEWNYGFAKSEKIENCEMKIKELEEEHKELVETNYNLATKKAKLEEEYKTLEKDYGTCEIENNKLRKRINQAIEYIEELYTRNIADYSDIERLEKILKGEE